MLSGGRIVANKRPGGRPPKRPRPPVFVDELGVVEIDDADDGNVDIADADIGDIGDANSGPVNATIGV